ncbi:aspartate/glutamate racemase family protein [Desulfoluna butyratoxydans]|uniref:Aspartate racemase n=1 Tax=Desulfoluna butyratoxydans TaxID=231438 RepID=A0A4U8YQ98_9BACT|nr:aspartate/glutamate racemase family protein [Desulfoluna butyratoxydans]VFQ46416.1 aspartate racemase [Desulfoluna butyratoxydans]
MKTIGLLGGMSWESTASYYKAINEGVKGALGGLHSAKISLYSVDFEEVEALQDAGDWDAAAELLGRAAASVEAAGADFLMICTNTMHKVAEEVEARISIPLLHIADATAEALAADGISRVGLLGTRFTMEEDFYTERLNKRFGLEVVTPDDRGRGDVHNVIYSELCRGEINPSSRGRFVEIIEELKGKGAEAVILGCTEIGLLVGPSDTPVPLYDTAAIHAAKAVACAIG